MFRPRTLSASICMLMLACNIVAAQPADVPQHQAESAVYWIDVRTPDEFQEGHVEGAHNIEYQDIIAGAKTLGVAPSDRVYLYCRSGRRSGLALESLKSQGYTQAINLGGFKDAQAYRKELTAVAE
jgi:phage shock protein E